MQSVGVVVPDQPWERGGERGIANRLTARPFGGGALYDPRAQMVKLQFKRGKHKEMLGARAP